MSYTIKIKCSKCNEINYIENKTPLWLLIIGRVNLIVKCTYCSFKKRYFLISANKYETLVVHDLDEN